MRNITRRSLIAFGTGVLLLTSAFGVACQGEDPLEAVPTPVLTAEEQSALDFLATELKVDSDDIVHVDTEYQDWSDSSLGCPEPDTAYLQVITPGYKYIFSHLGEHHAIHTGLDGPHMLYCE